MNNNLTKTFMFSGFQVICRNNFCEKCIIVQKVFRIDK
jgi:hypothetical protein